MDHRLGFLGAGNMAEAIARAAIDKAVLMPEQMIAFDPVESRREVFASMGVVLGDSNADVIARSDQVLLAVKPQMMNEVAADLADHSKPDQVVMSIMAGISTSKLAESIGRSARIVRIMPNTPMMAGQGMAGIALGEHARPGDDELAMRLFESGGKAIRVPETMLDSITAVSGSGPAYVFYLAEAMEKAATNLGLGEHARLLVSQTILGAAHLMSRSMEESGETAAELRRKVTSPGGTTEAAIRHMDGNKTTEVIINAIKAAEARSRELGG